LRKGINIASISTPCRAAGRPPSLANCEARESYFKDTLNKIRAKGEKVGGGNEWREEEKRERQRKRVMRKRGTKNRYGRNFIPVFAEQLYSPT
jgi:hypothetical protein